MDLEPYENCKGDYPVCTYASTEVIIIDDTDPEDHGSAHAHANHTIRRLFGEHFSYNVGGLPSGQHNTPADWDVFSEERLGNLGDGALLIIYYHGRASGYGDRWRLHPENHRRAINVPALIQQINKTKVDLLAILDCWMPTRDHGECKRETGTTEIIAKGETSPLPDGSVPVGNYDFTLAVERCLTTFQENVINDGEDLGDDEPKDYCYKAPQSILEIMKYDRLIYSNPLRMRFSGPRTPFLKTINRIKVMPREIRRSGLLEFIKVQVSPHNERFDQDMDPDDEGLGAEDADAPDKGPNSTSLFVAP